MSKTPGTLILLAITWMVFLVGGIGLIWQAIMDKSSPTKSKVRKVMNEIKFRLGFAAGLVLLILFLYGVFWLLLKW
jgi:succinate dehydrogenase hydrophobic anchor subunit